MSDGPFTRYYCPLDCGWHYDQEEPRPGERLTEPLSQRPDESFQDLVTRLAGDTARAHMQKVDDALREHLDTHTLLQAVTKAAEFRNQRDQARATIDRVQKYAEFRCTEEHANFASASWVIHLIEDPTAADRATEK